MSRFRVWFLAFVIGVCAGLANAQTGATAGQMMAVMPFENRSIVPGLAWIGESFPELLKDRLTSPNMYVLSREERVRAYDRLGVPAELRPSRATMYRIAEQLDVDLVLMGSYSYDGKLMTIRAQVLDMRREHLLPEITESGPLNQLIDLQTGLAWDVLHALRPQLTVTRTAFLAGAPAVRLDAFENYVRGIIATGSQDQIHRFREAVQLSHNYTAAWLHLGTTYYRSKQYDQAIAALGHVPANAPEAREANFYLGLAAAGKGDYDRAETAFSFVAARLPLSEVYNNLGVVQARREKKAAGDAFQKAVESEPNDPDYHFNLGVWEYRNGDTTGAAHQLKEALALRTADTEAKGLLDAINAGRHPGDQKIPLERLDRNYDESSFRQLAIKIEAAAEQRLAKTPARTHAQFHNDRGHEFLAQGFSSEAEKDFREAIALDPNNAAAHAGLARVFVASEDWTGARSEAETALRLRHFAEPYVVLASLELRDNKPEDATADIDRALHLEPANPQALALKHNVAAKLAEKAQPLPKP